MKNGIAPHRASPELVWLAWVLGAAVMILYMAHMGTANARDLGQWQYAEPDVSEWFQSLKQPDMPNFSCCGRADAYWADKTELGPNGETVAIITDTRADDALGRPHRDVGTRITIPANKIRHPATFNPTGHTIVFLAYDGTPYCYEPIPLT